MGDWHSLEERRSEWCKISGINLFCDRENVSIGNRS